MRERAARSRSIVIDRLRRGDLLEGLGATAALLILLAIDMPALLAIALAVLTYAGSTLLRSRPPDPEHRPELLLQPNPNADGATVKSAVAAARFGLTPREREFLPLLAQRLTDREIAERFCISHRTAENHVRSILAKLGLTSRREVADFCDEHGLLPPSIPPSGEDE